MVRRAYAQRSVFEVLLPDADKLWDPVLREVDTLLDDEPLVDVIVDALARRHPLSRRRGRLSTPAAVVLRMLVLNHLYRWSFDECEREVRGSLVYREFCGIGCERVPDAKTLLRLAQLIDAAMLQRCSRAWCSSPVHYESSGGTGCGSTRPSSRPTSTIRVTVNSWPTGFG